MKILVVDDEVEYRSYLSATLNEWGHEVSEAMNGEEALLRLDAAPVDVIVSDLMMPKMDGFQLLRQLKAEARLPPTILLTAFGSLERAIATIHDLGGFWFIDKPVDIEALRVLVDRAGAQNRLRLENDALRRELSYRGALGNLVGESKAMREVFWTIRQVAPTSAAVLITGESGTGKELVARAIHANSARAEGPFHAINCAAIPETLMESELFGHEKGAFTGAVDRRAGALELAEGGTLFLDEIGEMPAAMQAKLLRVLEDMRFRRLAGKHEITADVRVLAATNRDPMEAIEEGNLREDLYYRLNVFHIHLPPLRERKEDIPVLVESLIHQINRRHGTRVTGASEAFLKQMQARAWEGNVRELRNVIERAVILTGQGTLMPVRESGGPETPIGPPDSAPAQSGTAFLPIQVGMTVGEAERVLIENTLAQMGNNKTHAAATLGISAKTLHVKLKQYRAAGKGRK